MKNVLVLVGSFLFFAVFCSGCVGTAPFMPPKAPVFTHWTAPTTPAAPEDGTLGSKCGRATNHTYLSLFSSGDCSVAEAARNAGITKIRHVEHEYKNVGFFMYQEVTVIVYGD